MKLATCVMLVLSASTTGACGAALCSGPADCFREAERLAPPAPFAHGEPAWTTRSQQAAAVDFYGRACLLGHVEACKRALLYWQKRRTEASSGTVTTRDARTGRHVSVAYDGPSATEAERERTRYWRALTHAAYAAAERQRTAAAFEYFRREYLGAAEAGRAREQQARLELASVEPSARAAQDPTALYAIFRRFPDLHVEEPVAYETVMSLAQSAGTQRLQGVDQSLAPGSAARIGAAVTALQRYRREYASVTTPAVIEHLRSALLREEDLAFAIASDCEATNRGALARFRDSYGDSRHIAEAGERAFQCAAQLGPEASIAALRRFRADFPGNARANEASALEAERAADVAVLTADDRVRWAFVRQYGESAPRVAEVRAALATGLLRSTRDAAPGRFQPFLDAFSSGPERSRVASAQAHAARREEAERRREEARARAYERAEEARARAEARRREAEDRREQQAYQRPSGRQMNCGTCRQAAMDRCCRARTGDADCAGSSGAIAGCVSQVDTTCGCR